MAVATMACDHLYERLWGVLQGNDSMEKLSATADTIFEALEELARRGYVHARTVAQRVAGTDPDYPRSGSGLFDEIAELDEGLRMETGPTTMQRHHTRYDAAWRGSRRLSGGVHLRFVKCAWAMMELLAEGDVGVAIDGGLRGGHLARPDGIDRPFEPVDDPRPPGQLLVASPHLTNAPPVWLVAPHSVGELVAA